jgi:Leucine-rich repeat (LRR) protein
MQSEIDTIFRLLFSGNAETQSLVREIIFGREDLDMPAEIKKRGLNALKIYYPIQFPEKTLHAHGLQLKDISLLSDFIGLHSLSIFSNQISDLTPIANLQDIEYLDLRDNKISDLSPLKNLRKLEYLDLSENFIKDISPLAGLSNLKQLGVRGNKIKDFTPIKHLKNCQIHKR